MAAMKKVAQKNRKIGVMVMFAEPDIAFLDRKIDKKAKGKESRSALLCLLVQKAKEDPALLDV